MPGAMTRYDPATSLEFLEECELGPTALARVMRVGINAACNWGNDGLPFHTGLALVLLLDLAERKGIDLERAAFVASDMAAEKGLILQQRKRRPKQSGVGSQNPGPRNKGKPLGERYQTDIEDVA